MLLNILSNKNKIKKVKIKFTFIDVEEIIELDIPIGLSKEEENKYIDEKMEDHKFSYGY